MVASKILVRIPFLASLFFKRAERYEFRMGESTTGHDQKTEGAATQTESMTSEANTSQLSADAWERPMVFTVEKYDDDINEIRSLQT
jgi:hypothetical protein